MIVFAVCLFALSVRPCHPKPHCHKQHEHHNDSPPLPPKCDGVFSTPDGVCLGGWLVISRNMAMSSMASLWVKEVAR